MKIKILACLLLVSVIIVSGCTSGKNISPEKNTEGPVKLANNYYRFDPQEYRKAVDDSKVVMLFFKANWCSTCAESAEVIHKVFNSVDYNDVIGFEVHYNDEDSKDFDNEIIKKYQIAYQNALVILDGSGKEVFRTLAYITEEKIVDGIEKARDAA